MGTRPGPHVSEEAVPDKWWQEIHDKYVEAVSAADAKDGFGVIFYGDSITESWQGNDHGHPVRRAEGVPAIFNETLGSPYGAVAFGIGGDETGDLAWRLVHGELPSARPPKVIVLNIGTNDLGNARWRAPSVHRVEEAIVQAVPRVTITILEMVRRIRDLLPDTFVVLQALLPRGGDAPNFYHQPNLFTAPLEMVNEHLSAYAGMDSYIQFIDCGDHLLTPDGDLDPALIPDGVHPSPEGYKLLATCLEILVGRLVDHPPVRG